MTQPQPLLRDRLRDAAADALLKAAEEVMIRKGYDKATMQDIAAAAGCAVGTLYIHFKNKEVLFRAILQRHGARLKRQLMAALEGVTDPLEQLRLFVITHVRWAHDNHGLANLLCTTLPLRFYDFQESLSRIIPEEQVEFQNIELQFIRDAQAAGQIRSDLPAAAICDLVHGVMLTVLDQFTARPEAYSLTQRIELVWGFMSTGLQAGDGSGGARR